eukprot:scaffold3680_cov133-Isochrysis_galbana.AAC.9
MAMRESRDKPATKQPAMTEPSTVGRPKNGGAGEHKAGQADERRQGDEDDDRAWPWAEAGAGAGDYHERARHPHRQPEPLHPVVFDRWPAAVACRPNLSRRYVRAVAARDGRARVALDVALNSVERSCIGRRRGSRPSEGRRRTLRRAAGRLSGGCSGRHRTFRTTHQWQPVPGARVAAAKVLLRGRVGAGVRREVPHHVGGAVGVLHRQKGQQVLAGARRVAGVLEFAAGEAERVQNLMDDQAAPARDGVVGGDARHARRARRQRLVRHLLQPGEDEPQGTATRVDLACTPGACHALVARRLGHGEDDVACHARGAVVVVHRHEGRRLAVGRAPLANVVPLRLHGALRGRVAV